MRRCLRDLEIAAQPGVLEDGREVVCVLESDMDRVFELTDPSSTDVLLPLHVAPKGTIRFVPLQGFIEHGTLVEPPSDGSRAAIFAVEPVVLDAIEAIPLLIDEFAGNPPTHAPGIVRLCRSNVEYVAASDPAARVTVRLCDGEELGPLLAADVLYSGLPAASGDVPHHVIAERELRALAACSNPPPVVWNAPPQKRRCPVPQTTSPLPLTTVVDDESLPAVEVLVDCTAPVPLPLPPPPTSFVPPPLALARSEWPTAMPAPQLEAGVRRYLRDVLAMMKRNRGAEAGADSVPSPPPPSATATGRQAAWQLMHAVVLTTPGGCDRRNEVRNAESRLIREAVGPLHGDAAVRKLSEASPAVAASLAEHNDLAGARSSPDRGPYTAAELCSHLHLQGEHASALLQGYGAYAPRSLEPDRYFYKVPFGHAHPSRPLEPSRLFYKVPFEHALWALSRRAVPLLDGFAYIPAEDLTDLCVHLAQELAVQAERRGEVAGLGDGFAAAAAGSTGEAPHHYDVLAMQGALQAHAAATVCSLGVTPTAALRMAPACVHGFLFSCKEFGRLPHDMRIEAMRCLLDCGFSDKDAAHLLSADMTETAKKNCTESQLVQIAKSYARREGSKSSTCRTLQRQWDTADPAASLLGHACPYVSLVGLGALVETRVKFAAWLARATGVQDIEDVFGAASPASACRYHASKVLLVQESAASVGPCEVKSPYDFLKLVVGTPST